MATKKTETVVKEVKEATAHSSVEEKLAAGWKYVYIPALPGQRQTQYVSAYAGDKLYTATIKHGEEVLVRPEIYEVVMRSLRQRKEADILLAKLQQD